jgi:chromosome partitioning protein
LENLTRSKGYMFTLSVIGQKGGSGKTTVALGLAVAAARAGEAVVVLDLDPQTNAANWKDRRQTENPLVLSIQASRLRQTAETARSNGANLLIIDTPGKSESAAIDAARLSDLVLVPSRPQVFDMETLPTVRNLIRAAGDPPAFVLYNFIHPQGNRQAEELKELTLAHAGFEACPVHLTQRISHSEAQAQGQAPQEIEPDGKAAAELEQLYKFIRSRVNMSESEHHGEKQSGHAKKRA